MKVHVIEADMTGGIGAVVQNRDALGRDIVALAAKSGEEIHFHDFTDPVGGAPVIMLECSDAFIAQVRTLPGFQKSYDVWQDMATERKPAIAAYFSAPKPARPNGPKP
ncbi:MAG TPA: hypothetical protein VEF76_14160 [Patescibacteria group bacterium]|nr:hypothetical protein [Patescibacteria group bacterium]